MSANGGIFEIPLQVGVPQTLTIPLSGVTYTLTLTYRDNVLGGWVLDIGDQSNKPILCGVPLVTGADLLAQYAYLQFGGGLWVQTTSDPDAVPTEDNLGADALLYWVLPP